jgi:hypothetical protein
MARKLKTYQTSLGFFEQAIAAPSMKAALEAWGADSNLFHQGAAKESHDPDVIAATMAKPGVVLTRPVGSDGHFGEHAELPKNLGQDERNNALLKPAAKAKKRPARPDKAADRKAAQAYERERQRRERDEAKEEAARQKQHEAGSAPLTRRKRPWTKRSRSTRNAWPRYVPRSRPSRRRSKPRMRIGTRKRSA